MRYNALTASVKYGDYNGSAAADDQDRRGLHHLAKKHGIDTERYFVFGVSVSIGEHRDETTEVKEPFVELLATDTQVVEAYGVGAIQNWVDANGGVLPYTTIRIDATLDEVLLSLKRFEFVLKNSHIERVTYQRASE